MNLLKNHVVIIHNNYLSSFYFLYSKIKSFKCFNIHLAQQTKEEQKS